jgi:dTDP-4-dehydrorhamnose reductase
MREKIIVTGANGQLGNELRELSVSYPELDFIFTTRHELPLDNADVIHAFIKGQQPGYFINCAAYTAVDKAESEKDLAYTINAEAPGIIAEACNKNNVRLVHISTDYVFNGLGTIPYKEEDDTDPVNLYGATKLEGERRILQSNADAIILRTAWVYSVFGNNFVKTMLRLMHEKEQINVVNDQFGTPTYAADLAEVILQIILSKQWKPGIYHFSNSGEISWYDFAVAIKELSGSSCTINPIPTSAYPTPARRPHYSVLDKTKIQQTFHISIKDWKTSLKVFMERLTNQ